MKFYRSFDDIPELAPFTKKQQRELWIATFPKTYRDPKALWLLIPFFGFVALGNYLGDRFLPFKFGSAHGGGIGSGLAVLTVLTGLYHLARPHLAQEIRRRNLEKNSG